MPQNSPPVSPRPTRASRRRAAELAYAGSPRHSGPVESQSARMHDSRLARSHSLGHSSKLRSRSKQLATGGLAESDTAASNQDLHIADGILQDAALVPTETPSDAVVVPANPSFPSDPKSAAIRGTRRALAALPFNIKRGSRRGPAAPSDPSPTLAPIPADPPSPRSNSRSLPAQPETPAAPSPPPPRPVVSFRSYRQFHGGRAGEIQTAPPLNGADLSMPPPPTLTRSNPLADPGPCTPSPGSPLQQPLLTEDDMHDMPEVSLQELAGHSRHASMHDSDDGGKGAKHSPPNLSARPAKYPGQEPSSFACGRLKSESTIMALETGGSTMAQLEPSSTDGSMLPPPSTREWRPRRVRSASRLSMGAEQRPGRHRYTYGNESMRLRSMGSMASMDESPTPPGSRTPPGGPQYAAQRVGARMVRQASNVSLMSTGTPLELKGDYESSFMVHDGEERDAGDKQARGMLSKLAPDDSRNVRPGAFREVGTGMAGGGLAPPRSLGAGDTGESRREWVPRHKRSKSRLELGSERSDGSGFAYSFMYGIGSDHEIAMQDTLRAGRKLREARRQQRRLERAHASPRLASPHSTGSRYAALSPERSPERSAAAACDAAAVHAVRGADGSLVHVDSAISALSGMDFFDMGDGETLLPEEAEGPQLEARGSQGVVDFGGLALPVGPTFKQYRFPMGRFFRFSDGLAVPVPLERAL
eukprot:jgi/Ulvmu1/6071/UM027_0049.1